MAYSNMMIKIIAITPARGRSKAIPLKNMKKINKRTHF